MKKLSNTNRHGKCLSCGNNLDYCRYQGFENLDYGCDCFTVAEVGSLGGYIADCDFQEDPLFRIIAWGCVQTIIFSLPTRGHPVVHKFPKEVQGKLIQLWESIKAQKWGDDFDLEIALYKLFEDGNNILKEIYSSIITIATNDEVIQYESTEQERVDFYYHGVDVKREFDNVMTIYKVADVSEASKKILDLINPSIIELDIIANSIDYDYKPETYWDETAINTNIGGQLRRDIIEHAIEEGTVDSLPPELFKDRLTQGSSGQNLIPDKLRALRGLLDGQINDSRAVLGALHRSGLGGEYLPVYREGAVEIARIIFHGTANCDVVSIWAEQTSDGIKYGFANEYSGEKPLDISDEPLTLRGLLELFENSTDQEVDYDADEYIDTDYNLDMPGGALFETQIWHIVNGNHMRNDFKNWFSGESAFYPDFAEWVEKIQLYFATEFNEENEYFRQYLEPNGLLLLLDCIWGGTDRK